MDDPIIQNRIASLPAEYQEFVLGEFIFSVTTELANGSNLEEQDRVILSNGLMLYLLYFLTKEEFISFLRENAFADVEAIALVNSILSLLPEEYVSEHDEITDDLIEEDEEVEENQAQPIPNPEPIPTPPVHTMADDVQTIQATQSNPAVQGEQMYVSQQDQILSQPVTPNDPDEARWQQTP